MTTAHIYDWLTKVKQNYEPSCLLVHGSAAEWQTGMIFCFKLSAKHLDLGSPLPYIYDHGCFVIFCSILIEYYLFVAVWWDVVTKPNLLPTLIVQMHKTWVANNLLQNCHYKLKICLRFWWCQDHILEISEETWAFA